MKLLLVVNPISGGVDKEPFLAEAEMLLKKYRIAYRFFKTTGTKDEENLKLLLHTFAPDKVASVGGDGTTLFTGVALFESQIPMGIIPLGSANGMAEELGVNQNPIEALKDILMSNCVKGLDVLRVNDHHYMTHIGDVGINANLVNSYEKDPNRGMATYAKYFIEELTRLQPFPVKIKANNHEILSTGLMVGICNARKYGTGVPINVNGSPMDGLFEIVVIKNVNANSLISAGLSKFDDAFFDNESTEIIQTNSAIIEFDKPRLLQLDGEVLGNHQTIHVEMLKGGIQLVTNGENPYV